MSVPNLAPFVHLCESASAWSGPQANVSAMDNPFQRPEESVAAVTLPDPRWLKAKRASIHTAADLAAFDADMTALTDDLGKRPGTSVGGAIGWTVAGFVVALLIMLLGWGLLEAGMAMWEWLSESE